MITSHSNHIMFAQLVQQRCLLGHGKHFESLAQVLPLLFQMRTLLAKRNAHVVQLLLLQVSYTENY